MGERSGCIQGGHNSTAVPATFAAQPPVALKLITLNIALPLLSGALRHLIEVFGGVCAANDDTAERLRSSIIPKRSRRGALPTILSGCAVSDSGARAEPWRSVSEANSGPTAKFKYC
jgi:hypothetical protein